MSDPRLARPMRRPTRVRTTITSCGSKPFVVSGFRKVERPINKASKFCLSTQFSNSKPPAKLQGINKMTGSSSDSLPLSRQVSISNPFFPPSYVDMSSESETKSLRFRCHYVPVQAFSRFRIHSEFSHHDHYTFTSSRVLFDTTSSSREHATT